MKIVDYYCKCANFDFISVVRKLFYLTFSMWIYCYQNKRICSQFNTYSKLIQCVTYTFGYHMKKLLSGCIWIIITMEHMKHSSLKCVLLVNILPNLLHILLNSSNI